LDKPIDVGYYKIIWDGKDAAGRTVPTGVYLYRMQAGEFVATGKSVVIH
jgi:flagellar hook assembly protein FlgD